MRNRIISTRVYCAIFLLCFAVLTLLSSCSKGSENNAAVSSPSIASTPAETKMESTSGNWNVTVMSVNAIPKQPPLDPFSKDSGPENKFDTLQLAVTVTYTGPDSEVQSPTAGLIDKDDKRSEALKAAVELPGAIYMNVSGPGYSGFQTIYTDPGNTPKQSDAEKAKTEKEVKAVLSWIDPQNRSSYGKKTRAVKTGEKLSLIYYFQDSKDYANLKFVFADVPPIPLAQPKTEP